MSEKHFERIKVLELQLKDLYYQKVFENEEQAKRIAELETKLEEAIKKECEIAKLFFAKAGKCDHYKALLNAYEVIGAPEEFAELKQLLKEGEE